MSGLAVDWQGRYAPYEHPEDWLPRLRERGISPWILGQMISASHNEGRFRTRAAEKSAVADSTVRLKVEGITPFAPLAIISGRLDGEPLGLFGKVIVPYEDALDALVSLPPDAERGTYLFRLFGITSRKSVKIDPRKATGPVLRFWVRAPR